MEHNKLKRHHDEQNDGMPHKQTKTSDEKQEGHPPVQSVNEVKEFDGLCNFCSLTFSLRWRLLDHQRTEHFQYICPVCKEPQNGIGKAHVHLVQGHNCTFDEAMLLLPASTSVPVDIFSREKSTQVCVYCRLQSFESAGDLINHHSVSHIRYCCPICKVQKAGIYAARRHMQTIHGYSELEAMFMKLQESGRPVEIDYPIDYSQRQIQTKVDTTVTTDVITRGQSKVMSKPDEEKQEYDENNSVISSTTKMMKGHEDEWF